MLPGGVTNTSSVSNVSKTSRRWALDPLVDQLTQRGQHRLRQQHRQRLEAPAFEQPLDDEPALGDEQAVLAHQLRIRHVAEDRDARIVQIGDVMDRHEAGLTSGADVLHGAAAGRPGTTSTFRRIARTFIGRPNRSMKPRAAVTS